MRRFWIVSLVIAGLVLAGVTYSLRGKSDASGAVANVMSTEVDTEALARALDLQIYAFQIPVPAEPFTLNVWLEHWTRDADEPKFIGLFTVSHSESSKSGSISKLTVCLPTTHHPQSFVQWVTYEGKTLEMGQGARITPIKSSTSGSVKVIEPIDMDQISGATYLREPRALVLGQDIPLVTLKYNVSGIIHEGGDHPEKLNDVTWNLRARFTGGSVGNKLTWKNGHVEIQ